VREDPIISGGWVKAALVILVAGALGAGAYVLAAGVDVNLPDLKVGSSAETTLSNTTLEGTTIGQATTTATPKPPPTKTQTSQSPASHSIAQLQELGRCTQAANGDLDKINACFDRFNGGR
jgi:hypothetical protein